MPIEDVHFLKKNSIRQSYIFLVDSSARDRASFPTPSEYVVNFTAPFHNVIGLEVLHGSIPRTMYNVDAFNNTIVFFIYEDNEEHREKVLNPNYYQTAAITPGEYSIQTLIIELNRVLQMQLNGSGLFVNIIAETETNPPETTNKIRFRCRYPFAFNMNASSIAETLGFDMFADNKYIQPNTLDTSIPYITVPYPSQLLLESAIRYAARTININNLDLHLTWTQQNVTLLKFETIIYELNTNTLYNFQIPSEIANDYLDKSVHSFITYISANVILSNRRIYKSVDLPSIDALGEETIVYDGPRGVVRRLPIHPNKIAQQFTVQQTAYLTKVFAALTTGDGAVTPNSFANWSLYTDNMDVPGTNIPLMDTNGNTIEGIIPISLTDGGLSDPSADTFVKLTPGKYWIIMEADNNDVLIFYNDVPVLQKNGEMKQLQDNTTWVSLDTEEGIHFELSIRIIMQDEYHFLTAPGIYSLLGERYVVLRCPEIEENSYRSLAFGNNCLGLAKFQLGVIGYSENRLDFSTVPSREFHPIGKLQKITLRFETASGKLYDFKGVNHDITFAIHYLEPIQKNMFNTSILNPNYNADLINYMYRQDDQDQDSDDQDFDYDPDDLDEYRMQEARHLPSNAQRLNYEALYRMNLQDDE